MNNPIKTIKIGKTKKHQYDDHIFDSKEEVYFYWYCQDLEKKGYLKRFQRHCQTYMLVEAAQYVWHKEFKTRPDEEQDGNLLQSLVYTPDFVLFWHKKALKDLIYKLNHENIPVRSKKSRPFIVIKNAEYPTDMMQSIIDTKGTSGRYGDAVKFSILQKLMMSKHGIYVQKIVPEKLFKKTFYPERYLFTDKSVKPRKI